MLNLIMWCGPLFFLYFFLMLRKSNVIPEYIKSFDSHKQISRQDIQIHDNMLIVNIKWSKTRQFSSYSSHAVMYSVPCDGSGGAQIQSTNDEAAPGRWCRWGGERWPTRLGKNESRPYLFLTHCRYADKSFKKCCLSSPLLNIRI